jgi:hypothetical protein
MEQALEMEGRCAYGVQSALKAAQDNVRASVFG